MSKLMLGGAIAAVTLIAWAFYQPAWSHDAPTGWAYGTECCSSTDCAVEEGKVTATPSGWLIERVGVLVPYTDRKIKESRDGDFHSCWRYDRRTDPKQFLCLYVPAQSY